MLSDLTVWDFAAMTAKFFAYAGSFLATGSFLFVFVNSGRVDDVRKSLKLVLALAVSVAIGATAAQFFILWVQSLSKYAVPRVGYVRLLMIALVNY